MAKLAGAPMQDLRNAPGLLIGELGADMLGRVRFGL